MFLLRESHTGTDFCMYLYVPSKAALQHIWITTNVKNFLNKKKLAFKGKNKKEMTVQGSMWKGHTAGRLIKCFRRITLERFGMKWESIPAVDRNGSANDTNVEKANKFNIFFNHVDFAAPKYIARLPGSSTSTVHVCPAVIPIHFLIQS